MTQGELYNRSFLQNYLSYMEWQESPRDFHLWVGLTIMAAVTGRKIFLDRAYYKLYPNLYTGLVAESAWCKKSTAMNLGLKLVQEALPDYPLLVGKISPEELMVELSVDAPKLLIQVDEMGVFMSNFMIQNGILDLLTSLYMKDRVEYRTRTQGKFVIKDAFVTLIAGGVPSYIQKRIGGAFEEGFVGRFTFVHREKRERKVPRPEAVVNLDWLKLVWEVLVKQLTQISELEGEVRYSAEAGEAYDEWYNAQPEQDVMESEASISGYKGRIGDHALKFAILMLLNSNPAALVLRKEDIEVGIKMAEDSNRSLVSITRDLKKDIFQYQREIEGILRQSKRIMRTILFAKYRRKLTPSEFDMIIWSLIRSGLLKEDKHGKTMYYLFNAEEDDANIVEDTSRSKLIF